MFCKKLTLFQDGSGAVRPDGNRLFRPEFWGLQLWHGLQIVIPGGVSCFFTFVFFILKFMLNKGFILCTICTYFSLKCTGGGLGSTSLLYTIGRNYLFTPSTTMSVLSPVSRKRGGGPNSDDRRKSLHSDHPVFLVVPSESLSFSIYG
jgi:hypothetical protein